MCSSTASVVEAILFCETMRRLLTSKLLLLYLVVKSAAHCDEATTARVAEGNFGQSGVFNWLGVLKVHIHEGKKWSTALTGIVLVTRKHVLANADDIVKIPQHVLTTDSKAMFLPTKNTEWVAVPKSYSLHPEYEYTTINTIALVELDVDEVTDFPLNPICLPNASFNTSRHLYVTGFTDEHQALEKVIYKIKYAENNACDEFYNRPGFSTRLSQPASYVCGFATRNGSSHCVWDNGMALVNNASGVFYLVGFGVRGPGCAAPARFIDLFPYFPWIVSSATEPEEMYDSPMDRPDFRRTMDGDEEY